MPKDNDLITEPEIIQEEYVSCYECGHAIRKCEAIQIRVESRSGDWRFNRYFSIGCKPDYVRVVAGFYSGETRYYETKVEGLVRFGVWKSVEEWTKEDRDNETE